MAKTAKVKSKEISIHSRAARRASSPLPKTIGAIVSQSEYKPWMHNAQNAGINKKPKIKHLTRQQKARQQRGIEKADVTGDKLEKKVASSKGRGRKVQARRADWDDLNGKATTVEHEKSKVNSKAQKEEPELDDAMEEAESLRSSVQPMPSPDRDGGDRTTVSSTGSGGLDGPQVSDALATSVDGVDEIT